MRVTGINPKIYYKAQSGTDTNLHEEKSIKNAIVRKDNYMAIAGIAITSAVILLGIANRKNISKFIKTLGKDTKRDIPNDIKTKKEDVVVPEDYPEWHPPKKPKKNEQPTNIILDTNGNIIGKQGVNQKNNDRGKSGKTNSAFSFSDILREIQEDTKKYKAKYQKVNPNINNGNPKNKYSDKVSDVADAAVDAIIIDDLINMSRGGASKISSELRDFTGMTEAGIDEGLAQETGNIFGKMSSSFDDIFSGTDDFLSSAGDAIGDVGESLGSILDGFI